MATGMKYMLAMTWSKPRATKVNVGHQMAMILEEISRDDIEINTAKQTSQFANQHVRTSTIRAHRIEHTPDCPKKDLMPLWCKHL